MVAVVYNPTPQEWLALSLFSILSYFAIHTYFSSAYAFSYWHWEKEQKSYKPNTYSVRVIGGLRTFAYIVLIFGAWLGWKEGYRASLTPPQMDDGAGIPSFNTFLVFNAMYFFAITFSIWFGPAFFCIGIHSNAMGLPFFLDILTCGTMVVLDIFGWFIWYPVGILLLVPALWSFVSVVFTILFWMNIKYKSVNSPIDRLFKLFSIKFTTSALTNGNAKGYTTTITSASENILNNRHPTQTQFIPSSESGPIGKWVN